MSEEIVNEEISQEEGQVEENPENSQQTEVTEDPSKPSSQNNNLLKDMIKEMELELDVYGKKVKRKIDLSPEALKRDYQMFEANKTGMQKAKEFEKLFKEQMDMLSADPLEYAAKKLGMNVEDLAAQRLAKLLEEEKKSPEVRAQEEKDRELSKFREENERLKKSAEEAKFQQLKEKEGIKFQQELTSALSKYPSLPNNKLVQDKIVDIMLWAMDEGVKDITIEQVLPSVEAELTQQFNSFFDSLPEETIEKYLNKRNSERMRLKRISSAQNQQPTTLKVPQTAKSVSPKEPLKKKSSTDFFRDLEEKYKG